MRKAALAVFISRHVPDYSLSGDFKIRFKGNAEVLMDMLDAQVEAFKVVEQARGSVGI